MVLEVEVQAGNQTAPEFAHAGLFGWLDARPRQQWPTLLRGDVAWGTEKTMAEAEKRGLPYLFKLRQSDGFKALMRRSVCRTAWVPAGGGAATDAAAGCRDDGAGDREPAGATGGDGGDEPRQADV